MDIKGPNLATGFMCPCPKEEHKTTFLLFFTKEKNTQM